MLGAASRIEQWRVLGGRGGYAAVGCYAAVVEHVLTAFERGRDASGSFSGEMGCGSDAFMSLSAATENDWIAKESDSDASETLSIAVERRYDETESLSNAIDCG